MSRYTPLVEFQTVFEDDIVKMQLDQLSREIFLGWMPYMSKVDKDGNLSIEDTLKLINDAADILPEHVKDFKGLKDANGDAVSIETIVDKVYFMPLVSEIVMRLIEICQIGKGKEEKAELEGKSVGPQPELLKD